MASRQKYIHMVYESIDSILLSRVRCHFCEFQHWRMFSPLQLATLCDPSVSVGMRRLRSTAPSVALKLRKSWRRDSRWALLILTCYVIPRFLSLCVATMMYCQFIVHCDNSDVLSCYFYRPRYVSTSWGRTTSLTPATSVSVSRSTSIWESNTTPALESMAWTSTWWVS